MEIEKITTEIGEIEVYFEPADPFEEASKLLGTYEPRQWVAHLLDPRGMNYMSLRVAKGATRDEAIDGLA